MAFYQAVCAFFQSLSGKACEHPRVTGLRRDAFCPDCGYKIRFVWFLVKCRQCDARRIPRRTPTGSIAPMDRFCRHCGATEYRLVQKTALAPQEILYGLVTKEIDYTEERQPQQPVAAQVHSAFNPRLDVVEGEVIRKRYVTQSTRQAWDQPPFAWQDGGDFPTLPANATPFHRPMPSAR